MFADLMDKSIQPADFDICSIPEISIPEQLRSEIKTFLEAEEKGIAVVGEKTTVVGAVPANV